jgi:hypothetical protein
MVGVNQDIAHQAFQLVQPIGVRNHGSQTASYLWAAWSTYIF